MQSPGEWGGEKTSFLQASLREFRFFSANPTLRDHPYHSSRLGVVSHRILPIRVNPCHPWLKKMLNNNEQLTRIIIGAAMSVLNNLKPGLDEKLYERALVIELTREGLICEQQKQFPVHYDGQLIGTLIPDLIVNETIIIDPKVVANFNETHIAQMLGYLNITSLKTALLLNFKHARLEIKRISN
jgi:GxxExxY protein